MKKNNNKGFTLAELLIVVAIIAVLTAIAIPVFTNQLEKSREATDMANIRSAYAEVMTAFLADNEEHSASVPLKSNTADWKSADDAKIAGVLAKDVLSGSSASNPIEVKITDQGVATIGGQTATSGFLGS